MKKFLLLFLPLLLAGCVMDNSAKLRISPQERSYAPVKIAMVAPLSGGNSSYGIKMLRGAYIAIDELNNNRGINGRKVELLEIDCVSGENPVGTAADAGAVAVIAGYSSKDVGALLPFLPEYAMPGMIAMGTDDSHVGANAFAFRNTYTDKQQTEALASYLWYWRQLLRIGIMVDMSTDADYERRISRGTAQAFRDLGGEVVCSVEYRGDDFSAAIKELLPYNPQAVVVPAGGKRAAEIAKALRAAGYSGVICGADNWDTDDMLNNLGDFKGENDCIFVSFFSDDNKDEAYIKFRRAFMKEFNYEPGSAETQSYDAVKLLCSGLNGAATIQQFTRNMLILRNYMGAAAVYTMLPGGDIDRTIYINRVSLKNEPYPRAKLIRKFQYSKLQSFDN